MGGGGDNTVEDTPERKELAKISYEKYAHFENNLLPVRDEWVGEMLAGNDDSKFKALNNKVSVGNTSVFGGQQAQASKALINRGNNPNSGVYQAGMQDVVKQQQEIGADVINRSTSVQQDNYVKGLGAVVALGEKKSAQAVDGLNTVAGQAMDSARSDAQSRSQKSNMVKDVGLGLAGYTYSASSKNDGGDD
ncbi:hypothetical protein [Pseudoalteromonas sp. ASV78]|uniref:hypothetical protein n=1 Tax=Pseudoalteromonas sp. ASV78 TaxID=3397851 RepID=UPI0039FCBD9A